MIFKQINVVFIFVLFLSINSKAQEYLKVDSTKRIIRYFPNQKVSKDKINDTIYLAIKKVKKNFQLSVIKLNGEMLCTCQYFVTGRNEKQITKNRMSSKKGVIYTKDEINVKILAPLSNDCIGTQLSRLASE